MNPRIRQRDRVSEIGYLNFTNPFVTSEYIDDLDGSGRLAQHCQSERLTDPGRINAVFGRQHCGDQNNQGNDGGNDSRLTDTFF